MRDFKNNHYETIQPSNPDMTVTCLLNLDK